MDACFVEGQKLDHIDRIKDNKQMGKDSVLAVRKQRNSAFKQNAYQFPLCHANLNNWYHILK